MPRLPSTFVYLSVFFSFLGLYSFIESFSTRGMQLRIYPKLKSEEEQLNHENHLRVTSSASARWHLVDIRIPKWQPHYTLKTLTFYADGTLTNPGPVKSWDIFGNQTHSKFVK